jgi:transposase
VSLEAVVPYGWQFRDEDVFTAVEKGGGLNMFGLLGRDNQLIFETTPKKITSEFVFEQLERLSMQIKKLTVIVLDNATVHTAGVIKERLAVWQRRGLYIFYLPRSSPHLNIAEILWRKLKYEWLAPTDYVDKGQLHYAVRLILGAVGSILKINFSKFSHSKQ